jgi:hypothetical protein
MGAWEPAWVDMAATMQALMVLACMVVDTVVVVMGVDMVAAAMVADLVAAAMVACRIDMEVVNMVDMEGWVTVE